MLVRLAAWSLLITAIAGSGIAAQQPGVSQSYEQTYREFMALAPRGDRVAKVQDLVITRDAAQFTLSQGSVYQLSAVNGRTVGLVFRGGGSFAFKPPTQIEQDHLARFEKTQSISAPFTELVLVFTDTTLAELESKLRFAPGPVPGDLASIVTKSLDYLADQDSKSLDPDLMAALLNGSRDGVFYAHVRREGADPLMFMLNPYETEGVSLAARLPHRSWTHEPEVISRFRAAGTADTVSAERRNTPRVSDYRVEVNLTRTGSGNLSFAATARMELADVAVSPWLVFYLSPTLQVDSAVWEGGTKAQVFRATDSPWLWVKLDRSIGPRETRSLLVGYHGDLIERYGDFFALKSTISWYPLTLSFRDHARFDLTFHTPGEFSLASVGERTDSTVANGVITTHWVTPLAIRNASFNLGLFEAYTLQEPGLAPVTAMVSEEAHRQIMNDTIVRAAMLRRAGITVSASRLSIVPEQKRMKETVAADVQQSLRFFSQEFGPLPITHFYAAESPSLEGLAFPGLVDLSWVTFQQTSTEGEDEVFRAHEVAHQWWGVGVDFASYHDQWLSEGFANFSGLWYLQAERKSNDKYFRMLERWRNDVLLHRDEPSPIWLGYRSRSSKDESGYRILIYEKGAWILQMLRVLMLDMNSMNEDRFTGMMQEFYATYRGKVASTEDFARVVDDATGLDMSWFFKEWVYGTGIPTYRVAYRTAPAGGGKYQVTLRVAQENVPDDFQMYVPVTVDLGQQREARFRVRVQGSSTQMPLPLLPAEPKGLKFNALDGVLCEVKMVGW